MTLEQSLQLAQQHHDARRFPEAEGVTRQILALDPAHPGALHLLGVLAHRAGHNDHAADLFRRTIAVSPNDAVAYYNLGIALGDQRRLDEAADAYRKAIELKPGWAEVYFNLATVLRDQRKLDDAAAAYIRAIELKPYDAAAYSNLGSVFKEQGDFEQAVAAFSQAIALNPNFPGAYNNLGNALREQGKPAEAIAVYQKALALRPDYPKAFNNLGSALRDLGRLDEAAAAYSRSIELAATDPDPHNNLGNVLKDQGRIDEALASFDRAMALNPQVSWWHSNRLYAMHLHPGFDSAAILAEHRQWNEKYALPLKKFVAPHGNLRDADRKLRVGYVSPDFRAHPVGRFLLPLLANHDREHFEIFCYSDVRIADEITERLRQNSQFWRNTVGFSDERLSEIVREDGIDILVDLTMHSAGNRLLALARKPAPVQVTWLAYCSTTGVETIDYRLTDAHIDPFDVAQGRPPGKGDENYSEKSVRLPETWWCYEPAIATPEAGKVPALANGWVTFGCLNNFAKLSGDTLTTWSRILREIPQSRLVLHAKEGSHRQRALDLFQQEGIAPERIQCVPFSGVAEYYRRYDTIDIALDPFPCAGGTTTCDALWMGVPVITLAGKTAVGRTGVSILTNVGLAKLVAQTTDQYVRLAVSLTKDVSRLVPVRAALRSRMKRSPLCDAPRFAKNMEAAFRQMWREWCESSR